MSYQTILYQISDRILTITLNRPEQMNAFTVEMANELEHAFYRASDDDEVAAIVVTGAGKAFCCLLYTSPSPRDRTRSRMPSSA